LKIYTNEKGSRRIKIRRAATVLLNTALILIILFAVLLAVIARYAPQVASSPVLLIAMGILSSVIGLQSGKLLTKAGNIHIDIEQGLKGFGDDTTLLNYYGSSHHLLLSPNGVFLLTALEQPLDILADGSSLRIKNRFLQRFAWSFMGNPVGQPFADAKNGAQRAETWLQTNTQTDNIPTIHPLIVLTHPKAQIETGDTNIPVLYLDKRTPSLKQFIRRQEFAPLPSSIINQLIDNITPSSHPND
jgi:hypothetical protein